MKSNEYYKFSAYLFLIGSFVLFLMIQNGYTISPQKTSRSSHDDIIGDLIEYRQLLLEMSNTDNVMLPRPLCDQASMELEELDFLLAQYKGRELTPLDHLLLRSFLKESIERMTIEGDFFEVRVGI